MEDERRRRLPHRLVEYVRHKVLAFPHLPVDEVSLLSMAADGGRTGGSREVVHEVEEIDEHDLRSVRCLEKEQ